MQTTSKVDFSALEAKNSSTCNYIQQTRLSPFISIIGFFCNLKQETDKIQWPGIHNTLYIDSMASFSASRLFFLARIMKLSYLGHAWLCIYHRLVGAFLWCIGCITSTAWDGLFYILNYIYRLYLKRFHNQLIMKDYSLIAKVSWKLIKIHACINALYYTLFTWTHVYMWKLCQVKYTNATIIPYIWQIHLTHGRLTAARIVIYHVIG